MISIWFCLICSACWLAGCNVGPDYERPATAATEMKQFKWLPEEWAAATDPNDPNPATAWWKTFNDPVTNDLVVRALAHNTGLMAAAAAVDRARALLTVTHGARLPEADLGFNHIRQQQSFSFPAGRESFISEGYTLDLRVSYMVDIFGKLRRGEHAAEYDLFATENNRQALAHAVVSQVVATRIQSAQRRGADAQI